MAAIAVLAIAACGAFARAAAPQLIDQTGHHFTLSSLRGHPLVVTFVAARCTDACPLINARFARAQALFEREHIDARLLTITLEPEHDTPAVMRELAARFSAAPRRWLLATGPVKDVHFLLNAFGVMGNRDEHTTFVYVFDAHGQLRERILGSSVLDTELAADLQTIARATVR